jgi:hypothetical protein
MIQNHQQQSDGDKGNQTFSPDRKMKAVSVFRQGRLSAAVPQRGQP